MPTPAAPTIREASIDDLDAVAAVFLRCWQISYSDVVPAADRERWTPERAREVWAAHLRDDTSSVLVAHDDGAVSGVARFRPGSLESLYVDPDTAGRGVGRLLVDAVVARSSTAGKLSLDLWVFEPNEPAQRFYQRLGFELDGRRQTEPGYSVAEVGMTRRL